MSYLENIFSLTGKVALVTGASRGLGRGIANALLRADATVALASANPMRLEATRREFAAENLKTSSYPCDVGNPDQVDQLINQVLDTYSRLDILVSNAGVTFPHALSCYPDEAWEETLRVNLEAPFRLARCAATPMRQQGSGSIINITSIIAERGAPNNPAYAAAKGGLKQLTRALANDLSPYGIRVNNVGPGYFRTDMTNFSWDNPSRRQERSNSTLLQRWGQPDDLAGIIVLLASDASSYITGQDFYIDGGWLARL